MTKGVRIVLLTRAFLQIVDVFVYFESRKKGATWQSFLLHNFEISREWLCQRWTKKGSLKVTNADRSQFPASFPLIGNPFVLVFFE